MRRYELIIITIAFSIFCTHCALAQTVTAEMQNRDDSRSNIVFLGDSLTAGYGIQPELAYTQIIQDKIIANGLKYTVTNSGISGETTAAGLRRLSWVLRQPMQILVICLGANDGLRGIESRITKQNLTQMISMARNQSTEIKVALCEMFAPTSMGEDYTKEFNAIFTKVAEENHITLIPFFLHGVAGNPKFNQADGIHPTAAGHKIMAENMWRTIKPLLEKQ